MEIVYFAKRYTCHMTLKLDLWLSRCIYKYAPLYTYIPNVHPNLMETHLSPKNSLHTYFGSINQEKQY